MSPIEPSTIICSETRPCAPKEECVSVGTSPQCVCKRGYTRDPSTGKCRGMFHKYYIYLHFMYSNLKEVCSGVDRGAPCRDNFSIVLVWTY